MKGVCTSLGAAARSGDREKDYEKKKQPRWRKIMKKMKKIAKKVMKNHSRKDDEEETEKNGSKAKLTERNPEESEGVFRNARKYWEEEDKDAEKAEKKQATMEYIKLLTEMFEKMKESLKTNEGTTSWTGNNNREKKIDPMWWMEGEAKQENRMKVKTPRNPAKGGGNTIEKENEKDEGKASEGLKVNKRRANRRLDAEETGNRRPPPKIRKYESPSHIIIKERKNYIKGKGWKVHILKIKKSKKASRKRMNVKKYTILCDKSQSNCRIAKKENRNKVRMLRRKGRSRKAKRRHGRKMKNKSLT